MWAFIEYVLGLGHNLQRMDHDIFWCEADLGRGEPRHQNPKMFDLSLLWEVAHRPRMGDLSRYPKSSSTSHNHKRNDALLKIKCEEQLEERSVFHTSCKIEDTASSLHAVLRGQRSQYVAMRVSNAMTKNPGDYLGAVQRWAEGGVVLSLQTYIDLPFHTWTEKLSVWMCLLGFGGFIILNALNIFNLCPVFDVIFPGLKDTLVGMHLVKDGFKRWNLERAWIPPAEVNNHVEMMLDWFAWNVLIFLIYTVVFGGSSWFYCMWRWMTGQRHTRVKWPNSLAFWCRLLIIMDNLTYFVWFFTAFFWVFFNLYFCFAASTFAYDPKLMMAGSLVCATLQWGLLLACILRSNTAQRQEANAVQSVSMDSIWRSTQLFYLTAPLQLYSIIMGFRDYIDGRRYGTDSTHWTTGDRGAITKTIVKWWTLAIILSAGVAWIYVLCTAAPVSNIAAVVIVTMTALDVLHPCTYLWLDKCPEEWQKVEAKKKQERKDKVQASGLGTEISSFDCSFLLMRCWWGKIVHDLILKNALLRFILKYLGLAQQVVLPFMAFFNPYLGVASALFSLSRAGK